MNIASENAFHTLVPIPNNIPGNPNVRAKFVFDGVTFSDVNGLTGYYFWQIDDIQFIEAPDHDLSMDQVYFNTPYLDSIPTVPALPKINALYSQIPAYQFENMQMDYGVEITNKGKQTQTNTRGELFIRVTRLSRNKQNINPLDLCGRMLKENLSNYSLFLFALKQKEPKSSRPSGGKYR